MITQETRARILRLHLAEHWPIGTIAKELGLHHSTVRGALVHSGVRQATASRRPRMIDPYVPFCSSSSRAIPGCGRAGCTAWSRSVAIRVGRTTFAV